MKRIIALILILSLGLFMCPFAVASYSPLAELYFYDFYSTGYPKPIDTTIYASQTEGALDNAGYNCYCYTNVPAGPVSTGSVLRTLDDDAVFFIHTHASQGIMACTDYYGNITTISADAVSETTNYSLEYNFEYTTAQLKTLRIAYWMGCNTYGTSIYYGSLNDKSTELGIDCNITHADSIWDTYAGFLLYAFAYYGDQGQTVSTALVNAKSWAYSYFGTYAGSGNEADITFSSTRIRGTTGYYSVTFEPAGYGVY